MDIIESGSLSNFCSINLFVGSRFDKGIILFSSSFLFIISSLLSKIISSFLSILSFFIFKLLSFFCALGMEGWDVLILFNFDLGDVISGNSFTLLLLLSEIIGFSFDLLIFKISFEA